MNQSKQNIKDYSSHKRLTKMNEERIIYIREKTFRKLKIRIYSFELIRIPGHTVI